MTLRHSNEFQVTVPPGAGSGYTLEVEVEGIVTPLLSYSYVMLSCTPTRCLPLHPYYS